MHEWFLYIQNTSLHSKICQGRCDFFSCIVCDYIQMCDKSAKWNQPGKTPDTVKVTVIPEKILPCLQKKTKTKNTLPASTRLTPDQSTLSAQEDFGTKNKILFSLGVKAKCKKELACVNIGFQLCLLWTDRWYWFLAQGFNCWLWPIFELHNFRV